MLKSLSIENYAIIAKIEMAFDDSLNIITGETGAGKSILLGALGLIMGQRADSKVLYDTKSKCVVEAVFNHYPKAINKLLKQHDLDEESELIIRREVIPSGRSRAFVNDTPTTLDVLQDLSLALVDLNQQFRIVEIQDRAFQLNIIDALGKTTQLVSVYKENFSIYKVKSKELDNLVNMESAHLKELDFMNFQYKELLNASLVNNEQEDLESELLLLDKAEEVATLMEETKYKLKDSDVNLREQLSEISRKWGQYISVDTTIEETYASLEEVIEKLDVIYDQSDTIAARTESNPSRLSEIKSRIDQIYTLQKKHGVQSVTELVGIQEGLEQRLTRIGNRTESIAALESELKGLEEGLWAKAKKITAKRVKVFPKLQKEVNNRLNELSMGSAELKVDHRKEEKLRSDGADNIELLFKANKGTDFQPIRKVASGGETSRLMLSIKASVAHAMSLPTMIFDEIDTGVSGDVAGKMGKILKEMATAHQLICITHSPQVSAKADKHFFVHKKETKDRTLTEVKVLNKKERIEEIAKMLSGNPPSTFALKNAKELLSS